MNALVKRLIEVDLPVRAISEHARRDQNVRKGHLHNMHIWWATRPLASCRAVILATILPDPADPNCPPDFRLKAKDVLTHFTGRDLTDERVLRTCLLDFVRDFADWDSGVNPVYVSAARQLVEAAHPGSVPLILDPFAGAGSIPFEVLRVGGQSFSSDLNPVAVLLNKVSQEYLPRYGSRLTEAVEKWGESLLHEARARLAQYYPSGNQDTFAFAHIWARTVQCEGPGCGAELPMLGMLTISRKRGHRVALRYSVDTSTREIKVDLFTPKSDNDVQPPIVRRLSATCPVCGFTTPYKQVREQLRSRDGGTTDARLLAVGFSDTAGNRIWRSGEARDLDLVARACSAANRLGFTQADGIPWVPTEPFPTWYSGVFNPGLWGIDTWGKLFTPRQGLVLASTCQLVNSTRDQIAADTGDQLFAEAVSTCLALAVSKTAIYNTSNCYLHPDFGLKAAFLGTGMAMVADFAEMNPLAPKYVGGLEYAIRQITDFLERESRIARASGTVQQGSATRISLPDDSVAYVITDPPYYAAVPYADLSDLCYVWLKRALRNMHGQLLSEELTPKTDEIVAYYVQPKERPPKDSEFFEREMQKALEDCRRVLQPNGVGVVIFAHKGTAGWEAMLNALVNAGWMVTASWPIDTENRQRWRAVGSATLSSSVHLVVRPRENEDGSLRTNDVGDWRTVLAELPTAIHAWLPRLADEGIVGADAIFACLGPALEIFSRYSRVEKASGEQVPLREYLEQVWAAVSKEAMSMVFTGADATGFEEDARLTAMWLWTLSTGNGQVKLRSDGDDGDSESGGGDKLSKAPGYSLEYDAARKIAQGLGAHLEKLTSVVEVKGAAARLLSVAERTKALFGKDQSETPTRKRNKRNQQLTLDFMAELEQAEAESHTRGDQLVSQGGGTVLDHLHKTMILFAANRSEALRRFLVEDGAGNDQRFWRLAQALSGLYPAGTDEKRWVDGVLARKKGLGF